MTNDDRLPPALAEFIDAVNAHDDVAFLGAFTDDGMVNDWGREFSGKSAIKEWSDREFIGARGVMTVTDVWDDSGRVHVLADWRSNHANGPSHFAFEFSGDKIREMRISQG